MNFMAKSGRLQSVRILFGETGAQPITFSVLWSRLIVPVRACKATEPHRASLNVPGTHELERVPREAIVLNS